MAFHFRGFNRDFPQRFQFREVGRQQRELMVFAAVTVPERQRHRLICQNVIHPHDSRFGAQRAIHV
jgi:hypothetical protein